MFLGGICVKRKKRWLRWIAWTLLLVLCMNSAGTTVLAVSVEEENIPVSDEVKGICEMLGFEAMSLANEGTFVLAIPNEDALKALEVLQTFEYSKTASIIGKVTQQYEQRVILNSQWGTKRFLDIPTGELLPRIC